MVGSEDPRLVELLEICKVVIERDFAPCGLREQVVERVKELFAEWQRRYERVVREGRTIGGVKVIFFDLLRLVELARANSKSLFVPLSYNGYYDGFTNLSSCISLEYLIFQE